MKPDLTLYLAEEALKRKFVDVNLMVTEVLALQKECRDYLSVENVRKIYARLMKIEVTKIMVDTVYQSLTPEEQVFIKLKYKYKKQMIAISQQLNVSLAQLNIWHKKILEKIATYMLYQLKGDDIFDRSKVLDMVRLLERIKEFAEKCDPPCSIIDRHWLEAIDDRREKYSCLLEEIDEIMNGDRSSLHSKILYEKLANHYEKVESLAKKLKVDKSRISRHLKQFEDRMKEYLD